MRIVGIILLGVFLAVVLHLTWHFALPSHHVYSLSWPLYWTLPVAGFLAVGVVIARFWPAEPLIAALSVAGLALLLNQGVIPVVSVLVAEGRLTYPLDAMWWTGFPVAVGLGLPLLFASAWLFRPGTTGRLRSN